VRFRSPLVRVLVPLTLAGGLAVAGLDVSTGSRTLAATYAPELPVRPEAARPAQVRNNSPLRDVPAVRRPARAARSGSRTELPARAWVRPSRGPLTSGYGPRWGRMHRGIDFGAAYGSPIYAAAAGVVTYAGAEGGYGRLVTVRHEDGWVTAYGHMSRIVVRSGQRVTAGQVIAYVGSAGRSTGPHLHFEVRRGGAYLNPLSFLRDRGVRI
jgi:murein DD-endopeptidase MepM/ murein hydrolase activator NlpD